jgi:PPP family 3-phenylpropionic acid transporter
VTSVLPAATAVSLAVLERPTERFGRFRVCGTLGFLVCVVSFPALLDRSQAARGLVVEPGALPSEPGLEVLFWLASGLTLLSAAAGAALPRAGALALRAERGDLVALLRHRPYLRLLGFTFLAYFFLQAPIQLFPVFLRDRGGSIDTLGRVWIAMLLLEIPLVFYTGATLRRVGHRGLLAIGVAADGLRWLGSALAPSLGFVFALQLLHGVTIAGLVVGVAMAVESVVPERLRATGQAGVAMVGISLASVLSNACGGLLLERLGSAAPYLAGGSGALLLAASLPWLLPRPPYERGAR